MQKQDSRSRLITTLKHNLDLTIEWINFPWTVVTRTSVKTISEVCIFIVDFQYVIRFVMYLALAAEFWSIDRDIGN